jgi:hypothetical protein
MPASMSLRKMFKPRPATMVGDPVCIFAGSTALWEDTDGNHHIRHYHEDILTFMDPDDKGVFRWVEINLDEPSQGHGFDVVNKLLYGDYMVFLPEGGWSVLIFAGRAPRQRMTLKLRKGMRLPIEYDTRVLTSAN